MIASEKSFDLKKALLPVMVALSSVTVVVITILPVSFAQAVLQPGQDAPSFALKDTVGNVYHLDDKTSDPVLLLFAKPGDRHTTAALKALNNMFEKHPVLKQGLKRWVIISGSDAARQVEPIIVIAGGMWPILLDVKNDAYRAYRIIATPTVVVVGSNRRIEAINPGYDLGMEDTIRKALARVLSVSLPEGVLKESSKPNMILQMGRRMAARGLWERAAEYYAKAMEQEPLSLDAQIELAEIYLELQRVEEALKILNQISADSAGAARVKPLLKRAQAMKESCSETPKPPKVTR
jgi:tetratricopeptide (TPR) repeat protein